MAGGTCFRKVTYGGTWSKYIVSISSSDFPFGSAQVVSILLGKRRRRRRRKIEIRTDEEEVYHQSSEQVTGSENITICKVDLIRDERCEERKIEVEKL